MRHLEYFNVYADCRCVYCSTYQVFDFRHISCVEEKYYVPEKLEHWISYKIEKKWQQMAPIFIRYNKAFEFNDNNKVDLFI